MTEIFVSLVIFFSIGVIPNCKCTLGVVFAGPGGEVDDVVDVRVRGQPGHQVHSDKGLPATARAN